MEALMKLIVVGSAALMLLTIAQASLPRVFFFLPLGGSAIAEMGIVLGASVAVATIVDLCSKDRR
jgi:hypothetical protein